MKQDRLQNALLFLGILVCVLAAGCQTVERKPSSSPDTASDIIHYTGEPPIWIFIPFPSITDNADGYPAQIVMPRRQNHTTNRIEVVVDGEIILPGVVKLDRGGTVLQAIGCAGGFTSSAYTKKVNIIESSGHVMTLYLCSHQSSDTHRRVWYDVKPDGASGSDCVLEAGDEIFIPRTIF